MIPRYQLQYRHAKQQQFTGEDRWFSCEECIARMRALFAADPHRDFQIVDDRGIVIASTLREPSRAFVESASQTVPTPGLPPIAFAAG